jgi:hypothetical protein
MTYTREDIADLWLLDDQALEAITGSYRGRSGLRSASTTSKTRRSLPLHLISTSFSIRSGDGRRATSSAWNAIIPINYRPGWNGWVTT